MLSTFPIWGQVQIPAQVGARTVFSPSKFSSSLLC